MQFRAPLFRPPTQWWFESATNCSTWTRSSAPKSSALRRWFTWRSLRLIPPQYVRPFVKTNKNDAADAEAICEAVTRPTMRFAPAKSAEQQSVLMLHRARELLVRQRTMVINALRGHCAELGLIVAQGASKVEELVAIIEDPGDVRLPPLAREALGSLVEQLRSAQARIKQLEATLLAWHRSNQASRRLATIPGVGVITGNRSLKPWTGDSGFIVQIESRPHRGAGNMFCHALSSLAWRFSTRILAPI